jgi:hypothetical protein
MEPTMNTYRKPILTFVSLIALFWQFGLSQNTLQCFELEEIYPDSTLKVGKSSGTEAGEIIYEQEVFSVSLDSFLYFNGAKGYENVWITKDLFGGFSNEEIFLFPSNINLNVKLTAPQIKLTQLCFDFYDGGGQVNISINGSPLLPLEDLTELNQFDENPFGDDLVVSVEEFPDANFPSGQLCISGDIRSLIIGGQEMGINNICYAVEEREDDDCPIEGIKAIITDCSNTGYDLLVDLQLEDDDEPISAADSFQLIVEGQDYGYFAYNRLPIQLEGVQIPTDALTFEIAACDQAHPNCCKNTIVDKSSCPTEITDCIGFEQVELGVYGNSTQYAPGDLAFSPGGIDFYLVGMPTLFWTTLFGDLAVVESDFPSTSFGEGPFLFYEGISTAIDFTQYPMPVEKVSIHVRLLEGPVNVSANGAQSLLLLDLTPDEYSIGPDVTLTIKENEDDPTVNTLIFEGNIKSLLLGGMSMYADQLCINPEEPCDISEVVVSPTDCNSDGEFYVQLDFEYEGTADSFYVYQNGDSIGRFNYKWLPIELGPFSENDPAAPLYWVIEDAGKEGCVAAVRLEEGIKCPPPCPIRSIQILDTECGEDGFHVLTFDLKRDTIATKGGEFYLYTEDGQREVYNYDDLPISVKIPNNQDLDDVSYRIKVCDAEREDCCEEKTYRLSCGPCEIGDLHFEPTDCNEEGQFYVGLDFEYSGNTSDSFYVYQGDQNLGLFNYKWLPVSLGPFEQEPGTNGLVFTVVDSEDPNCTSKGILEPFDCSGQCPIEGVEIVSIECTGFTNVLLTFDLKRQNDTEGSFTVILENGEERQFKYSQLPVSLNIPIDQVLINYEYTIKVCDDRYENCCVEKSFRIPCNTPPCTITDLKVEPTRCDGNGNFYVYLNFDYQGTGDYFVLSQNGNEVEKVAYDELPIKLGPFSAYTDEEIYWEVYDVDNPDCGGKVRLGPVECEPECTIEEVKVFDTECIEDKTYVRLSINFDHAYPEDQKFVVKGNDFKETFKYGELPIRIKLPVFDADYAEGYGKLIICDEKREDCCVEATYRIPCLEECVIEKIDILDIECLEPSPNMVEMYKITFDLDYEGGSGTFKVAAGNGEEFYFNYEELPVSLTLPKSDATTPYRLKVCDSQYEGCCADIRYEVSCLPNDECRIGELITEAHPCNDDGTFYVDLNFRYKNVSDSFYLRLPDTSLKIAYKDLPAKIGPFKGNSDQKIPIAVKDMEQECGQRGFIIPANCGFTCSFQGLQAWTTDCDEEGQYYVKVQFRAYPAAASPGYIAFVNDKAFGPFDYDENELKLGPFDAASGMENDLLLIDLLDPINCNAFVGLDPVQCEAECRLREVAAKPVDCTSQGTLIYVLDIAYDGPDNQLIEVSTANESLGAVEASSFPKEFEISIPEDGKHPIFYFCVVDQPDCCARVEADLPDCTGFECDLTDLEAEAVDCNADGQFYIQVTPEFEGYTPGTPAAEEYNVYLGSRLVGTYPKAEFPVTVGPFERRPGNGVYVVRMVLAVDQNDPKFCRKTTQVRLSDDCYEGSDCELEQIQLSPLSCNPDGSFTLSLNFEYKNTDSDSFALSDKNGLLGIYALADLPLDFKAIPTTDGILEYEICIGRSAKCCKGVKIELPDCPPAPCPITDIRMEVEDCNEDGDLFLRLAPVLDETALNEDDLFAVYVYDRFFGVHAAQDFPISIGPVERDAGDLSITIEQRGGAECYLRKLFEPPYCKEPCPVEELVAVVEKCLGDDNKTLSFQLDFKISDDIALVKDSFRVFGLDSLFGPFAVEDLPVEVGPIPVDPDTLDQFDLLFEIRGLSENCVSTFRLETEECPEVRVWPGDVNIDRIANHRDLIYLGIAFGQQGPPRLEAGSGWEGIPSTSWAQNFVDGTNYKHADCNGDGIVDIRDKAVLIRNYGQTRGSVLDPGPLPNTDFAPPIFVDLPEEGDLAPGSTFNIPIVLGTADNPVKDIYGFAFSIEFDPRFIDPEKVQVHYPVSWFGQEDVNVLTIDQIYKEDGRIEIAMTRTDQNDVSGYGPVAYLRGIIADIAGIVDTRMQTAQPLGVSINTGEIPLGTQTTEIKLETYDDPYTILESFNMFPIPAGDVINFSNALGVPADEVRIFDLQGRQVLQTYEAVNEINVSDLAAGMYLIRLKIQGIVINEKFLKR